MRLKPPWCVRVSQMVRQFGNCVPKLDAAPERLFGEFRDQV